jgi:hypothetical protein
MKLSMCFALLALTASIPASSASQDPIPATKVQDRAALEKLLCNSGMTLQWISWTNSERGKVEASWRQKVLFLKGEQSAIGGPGSVSIDGYVVRINKSEFILNGTINIDNTPDVGRRCTKSGEWKFAITQKRKYWRLREFEWCDGLTDYIDIYF